MMHTILPQLHDAPVGNHLGASKTWEKVRSHFYWPGQQHCVGKWCAAWELHTSQKFTPTTIYFHPLFIDFIVFLNVYKLFFVLSSFINFGT